MSGAGLTVKRNQAVSGWLFDPVTDALLQLKVAFSRPANSGNNAFISAVTGKKLRVLAYRIQGSGTVNVKFTDTDGTDLSQLWEFQAREGVVATAPFGGFEFESTEGKGVQINLSAAVAANVSVQYVEVDG